jgi:hypothetical protein
MKRLDIISKAAASHEITCDSYTSFYMIRLAGVPFLHAVCRAVTCVGHAVRAGDLFIAEMRAFLARMVQSGN